MFWGSWETSPGVAKPTLEVPRRSQGSWLGSHPLALPQKPGKGASLEGTPTALEGKAGQTPELLLGWGCTECRKRRRCLNGGQTYFRCILQVSKHHTFL